MAKYSVSHRGGPAYEQARDARGLHVHVDASETTSIGMHAERLDKNGDQTTLLTKQKHVTAPSVAVAEGLAVRAGAALGADLRRDNEHLFLYTDNIHVIQALYRTGESVFESLRPIVRDVMEVLPSPTQYSIVFCDSDVNLAHSVSRQ